MTDEPRPLRPGDGVRQVAAGMEAGMKSAGGPDPDDSVAVEVIRVWPRASRFILGVLFAGLAGAGTIAVFALAYGLAWRAVVWAWLG